jgi:hypothetical protein
MGKKQDLEEHQFKNGGGGSDQHGSRADDKEWLH